MRAGPGCNRRAVTSATPRLCEEGGWWQAAREARARGTSSWGRLSEVRCGGWWVAGVEWRFARARGGCQRCSRLARRSEASLPRARQPRHSHLCTAVRTTEKVVGLRSAGVRTHRSSTWNVDMAVDLERLDVPSARPGRLIGMCNRVALSPTRREKEGLDNTITHSMHSGSYSPWASARGCVGWTFPHCERW